MGIQLPPCHARRQLPQSRQPPNNVHLTITPLSPASALIVSTLLTMPSTPSTSSSAQLTSTSAKSPTSSSSTATTPASPQSGPINPNPTSCSMPNYFSFAGPNATAGHGSLVFSLDWSAEWVMKWLCKMALEDIASIAPRQEGL
jgi:hypothetical protein